MTMRRFVVLAGMGLAGVSSIALMPIERLVPGAIDPFAARALALIQPALLTLVAVAIGCRLAWRVGLGTPLLDAAITGGDVRGVLRRQIGPALGVGIVVATMLILHGRTAGAAIAEAGRGTAMAGLAPPLVTRLLYGGITEELLTRWGLMTLFVWFAWRLGGRPAVPGRATVGVAILLSSAMFAAGHLPVLYLLMPAPPPGMVGAVLAGNLLPGLAFGWLYWRRGLEAAMIAHATAHLLAWPATG